MKEPQGRLNRPEYAKRLLIEIMSRKNLSKKQVADELGISYWQVRSIFNLKIKELRYPLQRLLESKLPTELVDDAKEFVGPSKEEPFWLRIARERETHNALDALEKNHGKRRKQGHHRRKPRS